MNGFFTSLGWRTFTPVLLIAAVVGCDRTQPSLSPNVSKLSALVEQSKADLARNPKNLNALLAAAMAAHELAQLRIDGASAQAVEYLQQVVDQVPQDFEALAYLGSANAMFARDSWSVVTKVSGVNKGLSQLDKAVRNSADNLTIRLIRGNVCNSLPSVFERKQVAYEDFMFVVTAIAAGKHLNPERVAEVNYKIASILEERRDRNSALAYFAKALAAAPESEWGTSAAKELSQ
jgi:tetratricopeptide (TPR) repeat protein